MKFNQSTTYLAAYLIIFPMFMFAQTPGIQWIRTYDYYGGEEAYSLKQTIDGGYIIAGSVYSISSADIYILKIDSIGNFEWDYVYVSPHVDEGYDVIQTSDSGYVVTGYLRSIDEADVCLIKLNSQGVFSWIKTYGGDDKDYGRSVQQTSDGGYIIIGDTKSFSINNNDIYLIKTNSTGDTLWTRTFHGDYDDYGFSIKQTTNHNYVIAGFSDSWGPGAPNVDNVYILKTDSLGNFIWRKAYGESTTNNRAYSLQITSDGGYILAGTRNGGVGTYIVKTNANGDSLWTRTYSNAAYSIQVIDTSGYIIGGQTLPYDYHLLRIDTNGDSIWAERYGTRDADFFCCVDLTSDGGYIVGGKTFWMTGNYPDILLIKTMPDTYGISERNITLRNYTPNISTIIRGPLLLPIGKPYKVYDITGREIHTLNPVPGIYIIEIDRKIVGKVIKIR